MAREIHKATLETYRGTVADSCDDAIGASLNGIFKAEMHKSMCP
jgi:hypothetical protein